MGTGGLITYHRPDGGFRQADAGLDRALRNGRAI